MSNYRIQVYHMGRLTHEYETDVFQEARRIYRHYNLQLDCWTQLYINGLTGSKAWMDRNITSNDTTFTWRGFVIPRRNK